jgi:hypothetical protein
MLQFNHISPPSGPPLPDHSEGLQLGSEPEDKEAILNAETLAEKYFAAGASIRCDLFHVKYGKYKGKAAGLIVFQANFDFPAKDSRIKRATIEVSFSQGGPQAKEPTKILHYSPDLARSAKITSVSIRRTLDVNGKVNTPSPADSLEAGLSRSKEETFTRDYYREITSTLMSHSTTRRTRKDRQCKNTVLWRISEDEFQKKGVPPRFRGAIIVQLPDPDRPFYAQLTLKSTQACEVRQLVKSFFQTFGQDEDVPLCFNSQFSFEAEGLPDNLEDVDLEQLLALPEFQILQDGY